MNNQRSDSAEYQAKKNFFDSLLTIFGRKPVLEALQDKEISIYKLHLADSNKSGGIIQQIIDIAEQRDIPIEWHDRKALSRISRNSKQDQGVAADIQLDKYQSLGSYIDSNKDQDIKLIALDKITNPQNLGMIIRSVCAGHVDGLILPKKGCASLSPLVIKASAGTLFKARILFCDDLAESLQQLKQKQFQIVTLSSHAKTSLFENKLEQKSVYVLGNETDGVSKSVTNLADQQVSIPMNNNVESLNVAITAALIAFNI